jgi:type IV pilus assembly protein PilO
MALSMPQNQRDQIMLAVAVIGLALAGAYYYFLYTPKVVEIETLTERVTNLDASNNRAKAVVARGTVEDMRAQAAVLRDNLDLMRTLIPASNEVPALLDQIIAAARRTGLDFSNFQPVAPVVGEQFDTHRYRMSAQGSFHQIAELLAAIGSLRRIIAPVNISLTPAPAAAARRGARPSTPEAPLLNATFDIQTYIVKSAPPEDR